MRSWPQRITGVILSSLLVSCGGGTTSPGPAIAHRAPAFRATEDDAKLVVVVGNTEKEVRQGVASAVKAGKAPLWVEINGKKRKYVFSPFAPMYRSKLGVVVVAYSSVYVFAKNEVELAYSSRNRTMSLDVLPAVEARMIDLGVARYQHLKAIGRLEKQYESANSDRKNRTCPDCAMYEHGDIPAGKIEKMWLAVDSPWKSAATGIAIWAPVVKPSPPALRVASASRRAQFRAECNFSSDYFADDCLYSSGGLSTSWGSYQGAYSAAVYDYEPCGSSSGAYSSNWMSSSDMGSGGECARRGKKRKSRPSRMSECIAAAIASGERRDAGDHEGAAAIWDAYCVANHSGTKRAACRGITFQSGQYKQGWCVGNAAWIPMHDLRRMAIVAPPNPTSRMAS